jgi:hypothetical protein
MSKSTDPRLPRCLHTSTAPPPPSAPHQVNILPVAAVNTVHTMETPVAFRPSVQAQRLVPPLRRSAQAQATGMGAALLQVPLHGALLRSAHHSNTSSMLPSSNAGPAGAMPRLAPAQPAAISWLCWASAVAARGSSSTAGTMQQARCTGRRSSTQTAACPGTPAGGSRRASQPGSNQLHSGQCTAALQWCTHEKNKHPVPSSCTPGRHK